MAPVYEITDQFYVLHTNCFVKIGECHLVNLGCKIGRSFVLRFGIYFSDFKIKFLCFIVSEISAGNKL